MTGALSSRTERATRAARGATPSDAHDCVVVGAGPNGLAAAAVLAGAGLSVAVLEAADEVGGGLATQPLTLPGYLHDVCSAVHPLAAGSPYLRTLGLERFGLRWLHPDVPLAHPLDDEPAVLLHRSIAATGESLDHGDARRYRALVQPFAQRWREFAPDALDALHLPSHPMLLARFGVRALPPSRLTERLWFRGHRARNLFAGMAAHSEVPGTHVGTAAFGLVLAAAAHAHGWPVAEGGSRSIAIALLKHIEELGATVVTGTRVTSLRQLPPARAVLLDITPRQLLAIAGDRLPAGYRRALERYRYGPGVFKVDWALDGPVPWRDNTCTAAGTLHLGGSSDEILASESTVWRGGHPDHPFVLLSQPSRVDPTRAPVGREVLWGYCHVPNGSTLDMLPRIEAQIERFAPGFRDRVMARHVMNTTALEAHDPNLVGGDISGGANTLHHLLIGPVLRRVPYATPLPGVYLCSASTPPGGGVHGMCGYHAASAALRDVFGLSAPPLMR